MWCLLVAEISHHRCWSNPVADSMSLPLGQECQCWSQPMGNRRHGDSAGQGAWTMHRKDNTVRQQIWEIAQSTSISNKLGAGPKQWDLLLHHCAARLSDLACDRPLCIQYTIEKTILNGRKLQKLFDEFAEVGLRWRNSMTKETPTKKMKFIPIGRYIITEMLVLLFPMKCG